MARRDDIVKEDSYSSTVRKVLITGSGGAEISSDNPLAVDGYQDTEKFDNLDRRDLLEEILKELKTINLHLQSITDERIKEDDIECQ